MAAWYNEIDPAAVAILREQIRRGVIADGIVDERSIVDVQASDLIGFTQCHFFAGGGLWSVACRMGGWVDERPIWTASCPCQPFSAAGKGGGTDDARHLWPHLHRIIGAARRSGFSPAVIVGEQVAGKAGYGWFNGVRTDLATEGYRARTIDFPACAVNAPHKRNRQYWGALADSHSHGPAAFGRNERQDFEDQERTRGTNDSAVLSRRSVGSDGSSALADAEGRISGRNVKGWRQEGRTFDRVADAQRSALADRDVIDGRCGAGRNHGAQTADLFGPLADDGSDRWEGFGSGRQADRAHGHGAGRAVAGTDGASGVMADVASTGWDAASYDGIRGEAQGERSRDGESERLSRSDNYWSDAEWIVCHDGKARRTKPGLRLLVDGLPGRVDLWSVGGNAIVPEAAALVIEALREVLDEHA